MWQLRPRVTMLKVPTIFLLIPAIWSQSTPAGDCCQKKTVSNVASEELNGVYNFKRYSGDVEDENCFDGCVYTKYVYPSSLICICIMHC